MKLVSSQTFTLFIFTGAGRTFPLEEKVKIEKKKANTPRTEP